MSEVLYVEIVSYTDENGDAQHGVALMLNAAYYAGFRSDTPYGEYYAVPPGENFCDCVPWYALRFDPLIHDEAGNRELIHYAERFAHLCNTLFGAYYDRRWLTRRLVWRRYVR